MRILKNVLEYFGYRVGENRKIIPAIFRDVYKSGGHKKVLVSYVTKPFYLESRMHHSNYDECRIAAEVFRDLGYSVDVVEQDSSVKLDYDRYDVIYGMGRAFERSFWSRRTDQLRIFYATGCNPNYSNSKTVLRLREFAEKYRVFMVESTRFIPTSQHCQILLSDRVLVLGNAFVLGSYVDFDQEGARRYRRLDAFYYDVNRIENVTSYADKRKHFLWFGSSGLIHKGLDALLEYFSTQDEFTLHVCGIQENEQRFIELFSDALNKSTSIVNHGFLQMGSQSFSELMAVVGFVIFPSVSEGGAVAVLNAVANGGLIPVLSRSTGLDIEKFGLEIEEISKDGVARVVSKIKSMTDVELCAMSAGAYSEVRSRYTMERYREVLTMHISDAVHGS